MIKFIIFLILGIVSSIIGLYLLTPILTIIMGIIFILLGSSFFSVATNELTKKQNLNNEVKQK